MSRRRRKQFKRLMAAAFRRRNYGSQFIAARRRRLQAEVVAMVRSADSLAVIPVDFAQKASVIFPEDAYGAPQNW